MALMLTAGQVRAQDAGMPTPPPADANAAGMAPASSSVLTPMAPSTGAVASAGAASVMQSKDASTMHVAPTGSATATGHTMDSATVKPAQSQGSQKQNLDSKVMNLRDVVAVGVMDNPEYGIVANNRRATDEELNQAVDLYFPSIDARADGGYERANNPNTRAVDVDNNTNLWRYDSGVTLTQLLFDGWETAYENQRQKFRVLSAAHRVREASELTGLSVVESYLEVMRQRELLKAARDNVGQHMDMLKQVSDSTSSGRTTQADVQQVDARVASARAEEASVRESLRVAEAGFIQQVGDSPRDLVMPEVPVAQLAHDVEGEVKQTQYSSPDHPDQNCRYRRGPCRNG